jgi:ADP-heptose:LPS heptosyltransferase
MQQPLAKNLRIYGVSYGITGDLIMGLPVLTYFEKLYPNSYKIWAIEKKVGYMAPFFLNHPLVDRINITQKWDGIGDADKRMLEGCYIACTTENWKHSRLDWYNYTNCIEETAYIAGVTDLLSVLSREELYPKLAQWFDVGSDDPNFQTYSKKNSADTSIKKKTIALWPFATATGRIARSPSKEWYTRLAEDLTFQGYDVFQFGYKNDAAISMCHSYMHLTFFDQVRLALSCGMSIGTDSGNMWVMGAYSHPAVHLMTNWMTNHIKNFDALLPVNRNGRKVFAMGGANNISREQVLMEVDLIMGGIG